MKAAAVALLLAVGSLPAAGQSRTAVRAEIPFAFEVANKLMPAGTYTLRFLSNSSQGVVWLREEEGFSHAIAFSQEQWTRTDSAQTPEILFNRYGDRTFLASMAWPGRSFAILKSKNEKALVTSRVLQSANREEVRVVAQVR